MQFVCPFMNCVVRRGKCLPNERYIQVVNCILSWLPEGTQLHPFETQCFHLGFPHLYVEIGTTRLGVAPHAGTFLVLKPHRVACKTQL